MQLPERVRLVTLVTGGHREPSAPIFSIFRGKIQWEAGFGENPLSVRGTSAGTEGGEGVRLKIFERARFQAALSGGVSMDAGISLARQTRTQYRHELHMLTYVTLDQANGGIVRNLNGQGIGVQAVAAPRPEQQLRLRFELRNPRVRIETRGEVMWSTSSGQCGIRFMDLSAAMTRQINEWLFADLLEGASMHLQKVGPIFIEPELRPQLRNTPLSLGALQDDGLLISAAPMKTIALSGREDPVTVLMEEAAWNVREQAPAWDWLSQPLSERRLAWAIDALVVVAGSLLFTLVFLAVTHEAPPLTVAMGACTVGAMYWAFFRMFGGSSLGSRLAQLAASDEEDDEEDRDARFR